MVNFRVYFTQKTDIINLAVCHIKSNATRRNISGFCLTKQGFVHLGYKEV